MPNKDDILWFKLQFGAQISKAGAGTPFDLDRLTAVACQETGEIWPILRRKGLSVADILRLCVGDTLDRKKTFPKNRAELESKPHGKEMFAIARQGLVDMAKYVPGYSGVAKNPDKFCHGFGLFQFDIQFFLDQPDYFLQQRYADFAACLDHCLTELKRGLKSVGLEGAASITDLDMAHVAIAYNTGHYNPKLGLKQGYFDGARYYGENYYDYLLKCRTTPLPVETPTPGQAVTPPPSPVEAKGDSYVVDTRVDLLNLRSTPEVDKANPKKNFIVGLPDGQPVRAVGTPPKNGFLEIETSLSGALLHGYVSLDYLKKAPAKPIEVTVPDPTPPVSGVTAVYMPRKPGTVTKRTEPAGAHSLNEPGQPGRKGDTPAKLCAELGAIIDWLAVDDKSHIRYQPRDGVTFCNIYAHDYCTLAGVYLPRVWWTPAAVATLQAGGKVDPLYGKTIDEVRANGLFRWLRDFGPTFGWRQTGTLSKLQQQANQGGVGIIVARRTEEGRPGHIVVVVPETETQRAVRDAAGEVTGPLFSQAGSQCLRYSTKNVGWWKGAQFAESAFWIHA